MFRVRRHTDGYTKRRERCSTSRGLPKQFQVSRWFHYSLVSIGSQADRQGIAGGGGG